MHDSGSSYTLVSTGLCKELGLAVNNTKLPGSYHVADGTARKFAGRLEHQVLKLHNKLALTADNITVIESEDPQFLVGQDVLSHQGNGHIRCTGSQAKPDSSATV